MSDLNDPTSAASSGQPVGLAAGTDAMVQDTAHVPIRAALAKRYIADVGAALGGQLAALAAAVVVMWSAVPHQALLVWFAGGVAVIGLRAWLRKRAARETEPARATRLMFIGTVAATIGCSGATTPRTSDVSASRSKPPDTFCGVSSSR